MCVVCVGERERASSSPTHTHIDCQTQVKGPFYFPLSQSVMDVSLCVSTTSGYLGEVFWGELSEDDGGKEWGKCPKKEIKTYVLYLQNGGGGFLHID